MATCAVFWDRDNTLIEDPGYLSDPDGVTLLPSAAEALQRVSAAGFENIVVTNQSGIARGILDEETLSRIHDRLHALLAEKNAHLDAIYYCPYLDSDEATVETYRQDSDLRKPKPGMLLQASLERNIDLAGSWSVGDSLRDAEAGRAAGCRTIIIAADSQQRADFAKHNAVDFVVGSLNEAVDTILERRAGNHRSEEPSSSQAIEQMAARSQEILDFLRMVDRREQAEDFSLSKLLAAITQILALGALIWAAIGLLGSDDWAIQMLKLAYAAVLQMLTLSLLILAGRK
jgi:D-glycero-D-manno-heptose 1,7-bisphosphate phosphatase